MYIGAAISITGNLFISIALNIQKSVHNRVKRASEATASGGAPPQSFTKDRKWMAGVVLMAFGELGNFGAYFFAPAVLVAPLGTVTVIANAIIAPCVLKERFRYRDMIGVLLATVGAIIIVGFAPQDASIAVTGQELWEEYLSAPRVIAYLVVLLMLGVGFYVLIKKKYGRKHILVPLGLTTVLGCVTILSVKAVSMLLNETFKGDSQFGSPWLYMMALSLAGSAVFQVRWLNYTMKYFDATEVVPTFFVLFTLGATSVGGVMYEDFACMDSAHILGFLIGVGTVFSGVYLITSGKVKKVVLSSVDDDVPLANFGDNVSEASSETPAFMRLNQLRARADSDASSGRSRSHSFLGLNPWVGVDTSAHDANEYSNLGRAVQPNPSFRLTSTTPVDFDTEA